MCNCGLNYREKPNWCPGQYFCTHKSHTKTSLTNVSSDRHQLYQSNALRICCYFMNTMRSKKENEIYASNLKQAYSTGVNFMVRSRLWCVLLPAAGRRMQLFHLIFTEPRAHHKVHSCTDSTKWQNETWKFCHCPLPFDQPILLWLIHYTCREKFFFYMA